MITFGNWLRDRRREKRLTQVQLAAISKVSASYISTLERQQPHSTSGANLRPEPDKVEALAKALDTDPAEALKLAGYATAEPSLHELDDEFAALFFESAEWSEENRKDAMETAKAIFRRFKEKEQEQRKNTHE